MAQLTVDAGVTLQNPIDRNLEGAPALYGHVWATGGAWPQVIRIYGAAPGTYDQVMFKQGNGNLLVVYGIKVDQYGGVTWSSFTNFLNTSLDAITSMVSTVGSGTGTDFSGPADGSYSAAGITPYPEPRSAGWTGGQALGGYARSDTGTTKPLVPFGQKGAFAGLTGGAGGIWDTGSVNHSLKFTVTADAGGSSPQGWAVMQVRMPARDTSFQYGYRFQKADTQYNFTSDYLIRQYGTQQVYNSHAYSGFGDFELRIVGGTLTVLKNGVVQMTQAAVADANLDSNTWVGLATSRTTVTNIIVTPLDSAGNPLVDPNPPFVYTAFPGSRVFTGGAPGVGRFADNVTLSPLSPGVDLYVGYHVSIDGARTQSLAPNRGQRTSGGLTFHDPVDITYVQPPPLVVPLGAKNDRIQRFQKYGLQAVFFKDQGASNARVTSARYGASAFLEVGASSVDGRSGTAGTDLADLKAVGAAGARTSTGVAGADLAVVLYLGAQGQRVNVGLSAADLLALVDLGRYAGRNGKIRGKVPSDSRGFWRASAPFIWPGGVLSPADLGPDIADSGQWGWYIVPTGADIDAYQPNAQDVYKGYNGGFYDSGAINVAAGDLYPYVYGAPNYTLSDPEPSRLPYAPPGFTYPADTTPGPIPAPARSGANTRFPPSNDKLRSFIVLPGQTGDLTFSDVAGTLEPFEPNLAMADNIKGSVWFEWVPAASAVETGHLSAPGTGIEVFTGPQSVDPTVGVNGYRGSYVTGTTYQPGESVLFSDGKYYVTSATTTHAPDYVAVADTPAYGTATSVYAYNNPGWITIQLASRVTLPAGVYYFVQKNNNNMDYRSGTLPVTGPLVQDTSDRAYGYSDYWATYHGYGNSFMLADSVSGDQAGLTGYQGRSALGTSMFYEKVTLTAPVTFDQVKVWNAAYTNGEVVTAGVATSHGGAPSQVVWVNLVSDPNPWTIAPDSNPLTFQNLLPVGGGAGAVSFVIRPNERYYARAYALGEESDTVNLHWAVTAPELSLSLATSTVDTPGYLRVSVAGAVSGDTINFTVDNSSTVLGTAVATADGLVQGFSVAIPTLTAGSHLLVAVGSSGRVGNVAFVSGSSIYLPPDPAIPPPPAAIPAPTARWRLQDPTDQTHWDLPINPSKSDSVLLPRTLTPAATVAIFGQPVVFEGGRRARRWTFSGDLFSMADVEALRGWLKPYRVYVADDFGRVYVVKIVNVQTTPVRDNERPEHHSYTVIALLYGRLT